MIELSQSPVGVGSQPRPVLGRDLIRIEERGRQEEQPPADYVNTRSNIPNRFVGEIRKVQELPGAGSAAGVGWARDSGWASRVWKYDPLPYLEKWVVAAASLAERGGLAVGAGEAVSGSGIQPSRTDGTGPTWTVSR